MATAVAEEVLLFSTLSILQLIKDAQQQHGLRHGDYQRYRSYCSRRLRRIRKSLHFTNVQKHKSNFQYKTVNPDIAVNDQKFLLIPLFEAERCWAFAMQLKQEANTEIRKRFGVINKLRRAVHHAQMLENIGKSLDKVDAPTKLEAQAYNAWVNGCLYFELKQWQKAMEYLKTSKTIYEKLSSLVSQTGGDQTALVDVYNQRCQEMAPQLRYCAFSIGDESAGTVDDLIRMKTEMQAGGEQQENLLITSDLDKLIAEARQKQLATAAQKMAFDVTWCNNKIKTDKPAKVQSFVASLQQFEAQLKQAGNIDAKVALYDRLLIDCRDAIQAVRDDAKNENLKIRRGVEDSTEDSASASVNDNQSWSPAQLLHSYLVYVRLSKTIERYLLMIDQLRSSSSPSNAEDSQKQQQAANGLAGGTNDNSTQDGKQKGKRKKQKEDTTAAQQSHVGDKPKAKPLDLVRLYDTVLQNLSDISALPGVQKDQKFMNEIDAKSTYFRAFRCYCVAQSFSQQKKWREALALYDRGLEYAQKAKQALKKVKLADENSHVSEPALDDLCNVVNAAKYCAHANSVLETSPNSTEPSATLSEVGDKPILETLDIYRRINATDLVPAKLSSPTPPVSLVRLPPDFQSMPCKPMFFDVAENHVQFPSLEEKLVEEGGGRTAAKEGGGLTGIMKGWLWGKK